MTIRAKATGVLLLAMGLAGHANATIIFADDFNTKQGTGTANGDSLLNWDGGTNWTVPDGSVDLVSSGEFGISCIDGGTIGYCVDLEGSTNSGGTLLSKNLGPLGPGTYEFSYALSGNQRGDGTFDIAVSLAQSDVIELVSDVHVLAPNSPWQTFALLFSLAESTDPINLRFFAGQDGNIGALLDNVSLRQVPEPHSLMLLATGLLSLGLWRKRTWLSES